MTKEQKITLLSTINDTFSQYYSGHLHTTEVEARMRAIVQLVESWETQSPTDAVHFQDWILKKEISFDIDHNCFVEDGTWVADNTVQLYKLFNPSGAVPQK